MPQAKKKKLTQLETLIMDCIWELEKATVREVQEYFKDKKPMAYNTVLTMMGILRDKGFLRSKRVGRADLYEPCVTRKQVARGSLREMCDRFFAGSAKGLISELLDMRNLSDEEIRAIRKEVDRRLGEGENDGNESDGKE